MADPWRAHPGRASVGDGFLFGVSDSGFQSEGGYNGPREPRNNWAAWEEAGRVEPAGIANEFWTRYPEHFERAAEAGCNSFRLGVEWTRCEPTAGDVDTGALEHYRRMLVACGRAGLQPVVALHHFTHPAWLGPDFWLDDDSPARFARWVERVVSELAPHCSRWTTINEINAYAIGSYLIGYFPPGRAARRGSAVRAMSNMLAAHVRAYDVIHRIQPDAEVGTNTYAFWSYDADRLLQDLLLFRSCGIERADLSEWLASRRKDYHETVLGGVSRLGRLPDVAINRGLELFLQAGADWGRAIDAVADSPHERCVDVTQVSFYDPRLSHYLRLPGRRTGPMRHWGPDPKHWEQVPGPEHLVAYLRANAQGGLPVWILENGMCSPTIDGEALDRPDGWRRPDYLRRHFDAIAQAIAEGIDVRGYFHWSLFDNYQWGEFRSAFGLYAVNREGGDCKFLDVDALGDDSAGEYRRLVHAMRGGDRARRSEP